MPQSARPVTRLLARRLVRSAAHGTHERRLVRRLLLGADGVVLRVGDHERRLDGTRLRSDCDREDAALAARCDIRDGSCTARARRAVARRPRCRSRPHYPRKQSDVSYEPDEPLAAHATGLEADLDLVWFADRSPVAPAPLVESPARFADHDDFRRFAFRSVAEVSRGRACRPRRWLRLEVRTTALAAATGY